MAIFRHLIQHRKSAQHINLMFNTQKLASQHARSKHVKNVKKGPKTAFLTPKTAKTTVSSQAPNFRPRDPKNRVFSTFSHHQQLLYSHHTHNTTSTHQHNNKKLEKIGFRTHQTLRSPCPRPTTVPPSDACTPPAQTLTTSSIIDIYALH